MSKHIELSHKNRAFEEMRKAALKRLRLQAPPEIAQKAGGIFHPDDSTLELYSLGQRLEVSIPEYIIRQKIENWHYLVLLHYLEQADGQPVSNEFYPLAAMKDGLIRGTKFDHELEQKLSRLFTGKQAGELERICTGLNGRTITTNADFSVVFPFFPNLDLLLKIWFADEEFPASVRLLISNNADHYITIEDAVTIGEIMIQYLIDASEGELWLNT